MIARRFKSLVRPLWRLIKKDRDRFLKDIAGLVHVGANVGQERELYSTYDLNVLWIEPNPVVFAQLAANIESFGKQRALQALVTDVDNREYEFHISNNNGASSSILKLKQHKDIWPDVDYTNSIVLHSITLTSLLRREGIESSDYQALIMDTQGSELLVLRGSVDILGTFKYIKTEVPDFESYEGCCQLCHIAGFMKDHGYVELSRDRFASREAGGSYFDIVYKKRA
jgi:FkbM family methyltransferase